MISKMVWETIRMMQLCI
jgi:hypothetical protein